MILLTLAFCLNFCSEEKDKKPVIKDNLVQIFNALEIKQGNIDYAEYQKYVIMKYNLDKESNLSYYEELKNNLRIDDEAWSKFLHAANNYHINPNWQQDYQELIKKKQEKASDNETKEE